MRAYIWVLGGRPWTKEFNLFTFGLSAAII